MRPSNTVTIEVAVAAPTITSARPSPSRSPAATVTPPVKPGNAKKARFRARATGSNTATPDAPLAVPTTMSARPSPVTSPAATFSPPVNDGSNALNAATNRPVAPSYTDTSGGPPGPGTAMRSSIPSPVTSPVATRTPPVKPRNTGTVNRVLPSAFRAVARPGVPAPVPTAIRCAAGTAAIW